MSALLLRRLGRQDYETCWQAMGTFTEHRDAHSADELWLVEHPPVFTLGRNGKAEHVLAPGDIPVIQSDRGGQVTYHGPGQAVLYTLVDLRRLNRGIRWLVTALEQAVVDLAADYGIDAAADPKAPGVYVDGAKLAALGLRVRHGSSFHGLSLNLAMDLEPFSRINPCGYEGLKVVQLADLVPGLDTGQAVDKLIGHLSRRLGYNGQISDVTTEN